jgi:hypothetical protein
MIVSVRALAIGAAAVVTLATVGSAAVVTSGSAGDASVGAKSDRLQPAVDTGSYTTIEMRQPGVSTLMRLRQ